MGSLNFLFLSIVSILLYFPIACFARASHCRLRRLLLVLPDAIELRLKVYLGGNVDLNYAEELLCANCEHR